MPEAATDYEFESALATYLEQRVEGFRSDGNWPIFMSASFLIIKTKEALCLVSRPHSKTIAKTSSCSSKMLDSQS